MNSLYHKVAVASICTAIGLILGTSEEVKAATITLIPTIQYGLDLTYNSSSNVGTSELSSQDNRVSTRYDDVLPIQSTTVRVAEFDVNSFFPTPDTLIRSAVFQDRISGVGEPSPIGLGISGSRGYGMTSPGLGPPVESYDFIDTYISSLSPGDTVSFDVTSFVNNTSRYTGFVSFLLVPWGVGELTMEGTDALGRSRLVIETADVYEPVPEPATIFGSALALGVGGCLKRKKSTQQNKTRSQH